ncbi:MAG TPA: hypothetical protein VFV87_17465, partial [Pirellulaceae bacterium]|nr:hypothetical protein [Pirellulaceae bacterium]
MNSSVLQACHRSVFVLGTWVLAWAACQAAPVPGEGRVQLMLDLQGIRGPVADVAFSSDEKHVAACGGKAVRVWDLETGQLHYTLRGQIDVGPFGDCLALAFSPDNCFLAVGISNHTEWGSIRIYDTHDFTQIKELLPGHRLPVTRLAFSHDSRYLAAADSSGAVSIFDWPLRRIVATVRPTDHANGEYAAFHFPTDELFLLVRGKAEEAVIAVPSGKLLDDRRHEPAAVTAWRRSHAQSEAPLGVAGRFDLRLTRQTWMAAGIGREGSGSAFWAACWNSAGERPRCMYRGHQRRITALALSQSCRWAASGQDDGAVHVWDASTGQPRYVFRNTGQPCYRAGLDLATRTIGLAPTPLQGANWAFNSFGRIDRVFDFNRRSVTGMPENAVFPAEFTEHAHGRLTLTFEQQKYGIQLAGANGATASFELPTDASPTCFTLLRHQQMGIANPVVVGDKSGRLVCYDPATRQPRRQFTGHTDFVTSLSETPDGQYLISSSTDGTIRVWSLAQRGERAWIDFQLTGDV